MRFRTIRKIQWTLSRRLWWCDEPTIGGVLRRGDGFLEFHGSTDGARGRGRSRRAALPRRGGRQLTAGAVRRLGCHFEPFRRVQHASVTGRCESSVFPTPSAGLGRPRWSHGGWTGGAERYGEPAAAAGAARSWQCRARSIEQLKTFP